MFPALLHIRTFIPLAAIAATCAGCGPRPGERYSTDPDRPPGIKYQEEVAAKKQRPLHPTGSPIPAEYEQQVQKAIKKEWDANCQRYRDFIIPGYVNTRYIIRPDGTATNIRVKAMSPSVAQVQKEFTLRAIRDADIPSMPAELKTRHAQEPLELSSNFHF